jgi:hypothetical protein
VPEEIRFAVIIWEFLIGPLAARRFVGGYYPSSAGALAIQQVGDHIVFDARDPLRIDVGQGTFFGVEESIFRQVAAMSRASDHPVTDVERFEEIQPFYSAISVLRDGCAGPIEFFRPAERATI